MNQLDIFALSEVDEKSYDISESSNLFDVVEHSGWRIHGNSSVKVLSENMVSQNKICDIKDRQKINLIAMLFLMNFRKSFRLKMPNADQRRETDISIITCHLVY